ncbi:MAG: hypothetical protein ABF244_00585 [Flavobacteriaceae bacterium]
MKYAKYNFMESYSNANGSSKADSMLAQEIGQLIAIDSVAVARAMRDAGVNVKENCSKERLVKKIYDNPNNKKMMNNLSAMIVAKDKLLNFSNADGEKVKDFFGKLGGFFKKKNDRGDVSLDPIIVGNDLSGNNTPTFADDTTEKESFLSKLGNFFNKNKEAIVSVGSTIGDVVKQRRGVKDMLDSAKQPTATTNTNTNNNNNNENQGISTTTKVLIGVGALGVIGLIIYLVRRRK